MRLAAYAGTSALAAAGALLKAFHQRPNFYSATVYLSQSNACVLILTNLALVVACSFIYGLQRLFYGPLRPVEIEQLSEKAWYAVLDTLLAMPSLRDEVGGWMLAIFVLLLAGKVWSWIGEGRVDILEQQPPQNPRLFHARLASSLLLSVAFSSFMFRYCTTSVLEDPRPGMMVIFTFEFAIQTIFTLFSLLRYGLALVEARILQLQTKAKMDERRAEIRTERERLERERAENGEPLNVPALPSEDDIDENEIDVPGWEDKRRWLFGLELATDFVKLIIYSIFFAISLTFMGLPMHIIRDVYLTFSSFVKRVQDYNNYRKATRNMNSRYPDASAQDLSNDNTCIVCREAMIPWGQPDAAPTRLNEGVRAKKLPCGHILHLRCLKAWLERQQACPTCRRPVIPTGSSTNNQPQAGNQNGAQGPNGAAPAPAQGPNDQPGAPNAANGDGQRQQNRLRMINLGPIRIGVYNGPAHQVQDALAQRRAQQNPNTAAPTPAVTPGLGGLGGARSADTQLQLLQIEERLMQEAQRLQIETTQLSTLRALEAELARLRARHSLNQAGQGAGVGTPRAAAPPPVWPGIPQNFMPPQAFQPTSGQAQMTAGQEGLPPGLVLPEGWTLAPLHRVEGTAQLGSGQTAHTTPGFPIPAAAAFMPTFPLREAPNAAASAAPTTETTSTIPEPPVINAPTEHTEADTTQPSQPLNQNIDETHSGSTDPPSSNGFPESAVTTDSDRLGQPGPSTDQIGHNGWGEGSSWSFDKIETSETAPENVPETAPEANAEEEQPKPVGKGKGRAVIVEDVEDAED